MTEQQMPARIWASAEFGAFVVKNGSCLDWTGSSLPSGYGKFKHKYVHRLAYEEHVGPILPGLTIDHICKNTRCVNPDHLRMMPQRDNTLLGSSPAALNSKKTHCSNGHALQGENILVVKTRNIVRRKCRICDRERHRRNREARSALSAFRSTQDTEARHD